MFCSKCSNSTSTCAKANFSMPTYPDCTPTTYHPAVPAHHFNLVCNNSCFPAISPFTSASHGVSSNAYNGYCTPIDIILPGHTTSCPNSPSLDTCNCNCFNFSACDDK